MPPPEWGEAAVRQLQARCGSARLAVLPDGLAVGLEQDSGRGLADGDVDGGQHRPVHAPEGLEVGTGIEHRDDDGQTHLASLALGTVNGRMRLM